MDKILIVDGNESFASELSSELRKEGYIVEVSTHALEAISVISKNSYNMIISVLNHVDLDGFSFIKVIKNMNFNGLFLALSEAPNFDDEIQAIELEIDGYFDKNDPIHLLIARTKLILKRYHQLVGGIKSDPLVSSKEDLHLILDKWEVIKDGITIKVTRKEMALLCFFLKNKNRVFTREDIIEKAFLNESEQTNKRTVDTHIKDLRRKLNLSSIISIHGIGYKWSEAE